MTYSNRPKTKREFAVLADRLQVSLDRNKEMVDHWANELGEAIATGETPYMVQLLASRMDRASHEVELLTGEVRRARLYAGELQAVGR